MEKRILDSVHGHIRIPDHFFEEIIDTPEFQRLRRVEQSAIRAVYPSARHDRFIHSLGVYYIGNEIINRFKRDESYVGWNIKKETFNNIANAYLYACLLHDIGHAPFSHTFESYYGAKEELSCQLKELLQSESFAHDIDLCLKDANYHELVSAYVAFYRFKDAIVNRKCDPEFVVRMITGCFYSDKEGENSIRNCFISLIHGEVVDADRLDYACRDVWASGYSTSALDIQRIVNALDIRKDSEQEFVVCFYSNVVNEIENLIAVKDFQIKYVINHHSVVYDQYLLTKAVEYAAMNQLKEEILKINPGLTGDGLIKKCMNRLCSVQSMIGEDRIGTYRLYHPTDDDFIHFMKQDTDNPYYKEWASRQYQFFALWKSPEEFTYFLGLQKRNDLVKLRFKEKVEEVLRSAGFSDKDFIIRPVTFKPKVKLRSLYILVHNELKRFPEIYGDEATTSSGVTFYYVFINRQVLDANLTVEEKRLKIIEWLKPIAAAFDQGYAPEVKNE